MRNALYLTAWITLTACTQTVRTARTDQRTKNPADGQAEPAPAPSPLPDETPTGSPSPNPAPSATPSVDDPTPTTVPSPADQPLVDLPTTTLPPVTTTTITVPSTTTTTTEPPPPQPMLPNGEYTLNKVTCTGGNEIPKTVTIKSQDGVVSVVGDAQLRNRLLGGAPSLTFVMKDGQFVLTSTASLPGYCGDQKPVTLTFGAPLEPVVCVKRWKPDSRSKLDEPKVFEAALRWEAQNLKKGEARAIAYSDDTFSGDFTLRVRFSGFTPGGRGGFFRLKLEDLGDPKFQAFAMVGNNSQSSGLGPMLMTAITNDGTFSEDNNATIGSRSQPDGTFTIIKSGKNLTVWAETVDGKIERKTSAGYQFSDGFYRVKLEAGNNSNLASLTKPTSIAFSAFEAGAKSDAFGCDSLVP